MKEAVKKVRGALSKQGIVPNLMYFLVRDGYICANDGRMTAAAPFPSKATFLVPGEELEQLLNRLDGDPVLTITEAKITLSSGKMRGSIQTLDEDTVYYPAPDATLWEPPPGQLLQALRLVRPFISDNATREWALCASLQDGAVLATNNVALVKATCPGLPSGETLLPCWAVDFVLASSAALTGIQIHPNAVCFRWDDGTWMRTQLMEGGFPSQVDGMLSGLAEPSVEITKEWRAAYTKISGLSEGKVDVYAEKITGQRGLTEVEYETESVTPDGGVSTWDPKYLTAVVDVATHWNPTAWPQPASFKGPEIIGLICGRT